MPMCGIAGYIGDASPSFLKEMLFLMRHRGYDEEIYCHHYDAHIGMNRLAIMDQSQGLYPMKYKHLQLVYNGEIYNYRDLRLSLQKYGVRFHSSCDAEVILPLYERYGTRAFSMLEGMFAICIFDVAKNSYVLARDKVGEKPLYYFHKGSSFVFASEMKALLHHPFVKKQIIPKIFKEYMGYGYNPGAHTIIKDIQKVEPSSVLQYNHKYNTLTCVHYWKPDDRNHEQSYDNTVNSLDILLRQSVQKRIPTESVGCFLSGGIDSSLIAHYISEQHIKCYTFSVSFPEDTMCDESKYSKYVSSILGTHHIVVPCTIHDLKQIMPSIGSMVDEPIADPAFLPTFLLSREARKKVKVVLTGEGSDELFAGYEHYMKLYYAKYLKKIIYELPSSCHSFLFNVAPKGFLLSWQKLYERHMRIASDKELSFLFKKKHFIASHYFSFIDKCGKSDLYQTLERDFFYYLPDQLLMKVDKSSMFANLETRCPFLDSSIISYAFSLSDNWKIRNWKTKYILRCVAEKYYTHEFVYRRKHGFSLPLRDWFAKELYPLLEESVSVMDFFAPSLDSSYYRKILLEHHERRVDHSQLIWSLYVMVQWLSHNNIYV